MAAMSWESVAERANVFALHAALYRWLGGRLVGRHILLLTTTGRRSGRRRQTPVIYVRDGDAYVIVASNGGDDRYPGWWYNLRADPRAAVQVGTRTLACRAEEVGPESAAALWPKLLAVYPGYARYRARTARPLTLFRLRPGASAQDETS